MPLAQAYSKFGYKKKAVLPTPLAPIIRQWMSSLSINAVTLPFFPVEPRIRPCTFGNSFPCRHSDTLNNTRV